MAGILNKNFAFVFTIKYMIGENNYILYLAVGKAFGKIPHQALLGKLKAQGMTGKVLRWTEVWFSERM